MKKLNEIEDLHQAATDLLDSMGYLHEKIVNYISENTKAEMSNDLPVVPQTKINALLRKEVKLKESYFKILNEILK